MMRGFQIWPQNSNRITFDLLLAQNLLKMGKIPDLANHKEPVKRWTKPAEFLADGNLGPGQAALSPHWPKCWLRACPKPKMIHGAADLQMPVNAYFHRKG